MEHPRRRGISHIRVTAILSVVILLGAGVVQLWNIARQNQDATTYIAAAEAPVATGSAIDLLGAAVDPITGVTDTAVGEIVGAYAGLQHTHTYSTSTGENIGGIIGTQLQAPVTYTALTAQAITTTPDTSYAAMMHYRAALQEGLKPLLQNKMPEYELFGLYVQTKQQSYLDQLKAAQANYEAAASTTATITVPADAIAVHLNLVNSMREFAATLDALISHADDPIASTVLLKNYNQAENDVLTAFQALVTYEKSKHQ